MEITFQQGSHVFSPWDGFWYRVASLAAPPNWLGRAPLEAVTSGM